MERVNSHSGRNSVYCVCGGYRDGKQINEVHLINDLLHFPPFIAYGRIFFNNL